MSSAVTLHIFSLGPLVCEHFTVDRSQLLKHCLLTRTQTLYSYQWKRSSQSKKGSASQLGLMRRLFVTKNDPRSDVLSPSQKNSLCWFHGGLGFCFVQSPARSILVVARRKTTSSFRWLTPCTKMILWLAMMNAYNPQTRVQSFVWGSGVYS